MPPKYLDAFDLPLEYIVLGYTDNRDVGIYISLYFIERHVASVLLSYAALVFSHSSTTA